MDSNSLPKCARPNCNDTVELKNNGKPKRICPRHLKIQSRYDNRKRLQSASNNGDSLNQPSQLPNNTQSTSQTTKSTDKTELKEHNELKQEIIDENVIQNPDGSTRTLRTTATKIKSQTWTKALETEFTTEFKNLIDRDCEKSDEDLWKYQEHIWDKRFKLDDWNEEDLAKEHLLKEFQRANDEIKGIHHAHSDPITFENTLLEDTSDFITAFYMKKAWNPDWFHFAVEEMRVTEPFFAKCDRFKDFWPSKAIRVIGYLYDNETKDRYKVSMPYIIAKKIQQKPVQATELQNQLQAFRHSDVPQLLLTDEAKRAIKILTKIDKLSQKNWEIETNWKEARAFMENIPYESAQVMKYVSSPAWNDFEARHLKEVRRLQNVGKSKEDRLKGLQKGISTSRLMMRYGNVKKRKQEIEEMEKEIKDILNNPPIHDDEDDFLDDVSI